MRRCKTRAAGLVTRPAALAVLAILGIVQNCFYVTS